MTQVFYQRQVSSRESRRTPSFCALARRLAYWFVAPGFDSS